MEQLIERINKLAMPVKAGIVIGLGIVLTAVGYFLFVEPVQSELDSLRVQQEAAEKTLAEKTQIADNLNERRKEMDLLEQKLQEALTQLPEKKDIEDLLAQLNDVGKKSGLDIGVVTPGTEHAKGFIAEIPITVAVSGNYHEIAMFLQEIANLRRIVNVAQLKLGNPSVRNDKVILSSEFVATTFRFNQPKAGKK